MPLIGLILWMGIYPQPVLNVFDVAIQNIVTNYQTALAAAADPLSVAAR